MTGSGLPCPVPQQLLLRDRLADATEGVAGASGKSAMEQGSPGDPGLRRGEVADGWTCIAVLQGRHNACVLGNDSLGWPSR